MLSTFVFILFLVSPIGTVPLNDFFPHGSAVGDSIMQLYGVTEKNFPLPYVFPYFDNINNQIWITNNGIFSFLQPQYRFTVPRPFSSLNNSSFVTGFWHLIYVSPANDTENKMYYQIHSNTFLSNSTVKVFNKATDYVRNFFPQQRPFKPNMVITGTWYNISVKNNQTEELSNTFQTVLCTDEDRSFVFFLYYNLQWSDPYNYTFDNYNARAGFYDDNRNRSETLPYSGTEDIVKLANESNVNVPGLFAFRVDADEINAGGCHENVSMISFRPRISSQLGSTALSIYGPCFTNQTKVKCRFGSSTATVDGIIVDKFRAICLTPFASVYGPISVNISIDNGRTFISAGTFTYAPLQFGSDEINIETENGDNLLNVGQYVKLKWHFSEIIKNTLPNGTKIDIELWEISFNPQSQLRKNNQSIVLGQNLNFADSARIQLPTSISNISTCFIRVKAHFNSRAYAGLNTGLLTIRSQPSVASEICQNWAAQQPEPSTWNNDGLLLCPMTRLQAIMGGRCCYKSDQQCYKGSSNPNNCWLHQARPGRDEPSAVECYVSITTNRHGAEAECCYDNDTMLITRGTGAGTDDRYGLSTSPVKHFFHDILPYLQCCMMGANIDMCNKYMYYRPPRRGSNTMGETGRMWGDPHFGTLDGTSYTFNGYGEYTYLAISNNTSPPTAFNTINQSYVFMSQIRTIPLLPSNVTVTKGFAARSNNAGAESVSVTISRREQLVLRRGNEPVEFEDNIDTLYFPELTITRLDGDNNSHFSLSWTIGVTIEINMIKITSPSKQLVLNIAASVAGIFRGRTYGLLGTYDDTASNDLRSKNGTLIRSNASLEQIHQDFGVTWVINPSNSLFYYESNQSAQFFQEQNSVFVPPFTDPIAANNSTIWKICKINATSLRSSWNVAQRTCYYDLAMTNDTIFAQTSFHAGNEFLSSQENQKNPPLFNLSLPLSMNKTHGDPVNLVISASSEYSSHVVELSALHLPKNSTFDRNTGIFKWTAAEGEHYLSIEARDTTYNLTSKHDIIFYVKAVGKPIIDPNNGGNGQFQQASFIISIFGILVLFCQ